MIAPHELNIQGLFTRKIQYVIPLFQRTYDWNNENWEKLWDDITDLYNHESPQLHFLGVTVVQPLDPPTVNVPRVLLIDGQQRLTTLSILLAVLRNKAKLTLQNDLADEINSLLIDRHERNDKHLKIVPTKQDQICFKNLIKPDYSNNDPTQNNNNLHNAYRFFERKISKSRIDPQKLKQIITLYLYIVEITLLENEDPYRIFESLNATGKALTPADLVRNFFFMNIPNSEHDQYYENYWQPMQDSLKEHLTTFIRFFLMKDGIAVKESNVYSETKSNIGTDTTTVKNKLIELSQFAKYYEKITDPNKEPDTQIKKYLHRLKKLGYTATHPFLLNIYHRYEQNNLCKDDFITILKRVECFLVRRLVCCVPSNQLNKIFCKLYNTVCQTFAEYPQSGFIHAVCAALYDKDYPNDTIFKKHFASLKLTKNPKNNVRKLILETLEDSYNHKEEINFDNPQITIEHVMPQTPSSEWQTELGTNWETIHRKYLNHIGNLTLTAYNSELSNKTFNEKKKLYQESHFQLNTYFSAIDKWDEKSIIERGEKLAEKAATVWKYFGPVADQF
ncbi:MAG: DUF262 domain-containing HNH endonuclease family protein [Planctomycetaceae bacterium]|jgi:uncharacterized protein with ParB-like and HNH nuclease domain|nr:DUF262 domain-containing HNH endonuclease family protein [Planctomycetaceae bacterium]